MKDDAEIIAEVDKNKMLETVLQFPEQVEEAINLGYGVKLKKSSLKT
jgi:hypothetical protein